MRFSPLTRKRYRAARVHVPVQPAAAPHGVTPGAAPKGAAEHKGPAERRGKEGETQKQE